MSLRKDRQLTWYSETAKLPKVLVLVYLVRVKARPLQGIHHRFKYGHAGD